MKNEQTQKKSARPLGEKRTLFLPSLAALTSSALHGERQVVEGIVLKTKTPSERKTKAPGVVVSASPQCTLID